VDAQRLDDVFRLSSSSPSSSPLPSCIDDSFDLVVIVIISLLIILCISILVVRATLIVLPCGGSLRRGRWPSLPLLRFHVLCR
jgi:hypothetical protein